jgi:hypothetical protein
MKFTNLIRYLSFTTLKYNIAETTNRNSDRKLKMLNGFFTKLMIFSQNINPDRMKKDSLLDSSFTILNKFD